MKQTIDNTGVKFTALHWLALAFCTAVQTVWVLEHIVFQTQAKSFASSPLWLAPAASILAAAGVLRLSTRWQSLWKAMHLTGLLLMVWAANGIVFDLLTMAGLIGDPATGQIAKVNWPGTGARASALGAAVTLALLALKRPITAGSVQSFSWYGYAAFVLALPYPVFRIIWALGGTQGLSREGAGGVGFEPVIFAVPWMLAAVLSLMLVSPRKWKPRRLLLIAGWTATALVASIGPAALWSVIKTLISGAGVIKSDIAVWVFCLLYGSWFLWAIAAFAATRSYQLRSVRFDQS